MTENQMSVEMVRRILSDLTAENVRTKASLEKAFGITLMSDEQTSSFALYEAHAVNLRDLRVQEISYREPLKDSGATAGAILIIRLNSEPCIDRDNLLAAYPKMEISGPPSPDDPDPNQYYSQETSLTTLNFGFPLYGKACLREIIFSLKQP